MRLARLVRNDTGDDGTFGTLFIGEKFFATGELPDKGNAPEASCIPPGKYRCKWTFSNRFQREMYQVMDVPGRSGIRFHSGNYCGDKSCGKACDIEGCILLGRLLGTLAKQRAVMASKAAIEDFEELMAGEEFELEITNQYGPVK